MTLLYRLNDKNIILYITSYKSGMEFAGVHLDASAHWRLEQDRMCSRWISAAEQNI